MNRTVGTMKWAIFILLMSSAGLAMVGCGGGSANNSGGGDILNPVDGGQGTGVIYCGGYYMDGGAKKPCYWTSGGTQPVNLDATGLTTADVNGICFYNGKVYCIGNDYVGSGNVPYYWAGAQRYALNNSSSIDTAVECFSILGGKIYIGGYSWTDYSTCVPCYWVADGATNTRHGLSSAGPDSVNKAGVRSCYAHGDKVYFGGYYDNGNWLPCYWDGESAADIHPLPLTTAFFYGLVKYIRVSDTQIDCIDSNGGVDAHSLKQGGTLTTQDVAQDQTGSDGIWTNPVCMVNGTVYSAGVFYTNNWTVIHPCCWVGSTRYDLPIGSSGVSGNVMTMCVRNGVVYCGGYYNDGTTNIACYWVINGTDITRHDLDGENAVVNAIFVD